MASTPSYWFQDAAKNSSVSWASLTETALPGEHDEGGDCVQSRDRHLVAGQQRGRVALEELLCARLAAASRDGHLGLRRVERQQGLIERLYAAHEE